MTITANEIKTKGLSSIDNMLNKEHEVVVTVRGKEKYIILNVDRYNRFREYELEVAIIEAKNDIKNKNFVVESVEEHIKRVTSEL